MPNTDILGQATMSVPSQGYDSDGCNLPIVLFVDCVELFDLSLVHSEGFFFTSVAASFRAGQR
jgi:hypothetical protein